MKKIPMLEKFAAQSLVEYDGELIFSKEKFAELIVQECMNVLAESREVRQTAYYYRNRIAKHFGVEE
jgi:hypothetical protein